MSNTIRTNHVDYDALREAIMWAVFWQTLPFALLCGVITAGIVAVAISPWVARQHQRNKQGDQ